MSVEPASTRGALSPLDRARQVSRALSDGARLARFSTKRRGGLRTGGFAARRGARFLRLFTIVSFIMCVAIPSAVISAYYLFFASKQYVSEARFSVTVAQVPSLDGLSALAGLASVAIVRDTQIVTNYIVSRAAIEALEAKIGLRKRYSGSGIDWWARFDDTKPIERLVRYWDGMVGASISMPAGIVNLSVRAFTAEDAHLIAKTVVQISEELINEQNERIHNDAVSASAEDLRRASARLTTARITIERARTDVGVLDTTKAAEALNKLIADARGQLLQLQNEFATRSRFIAVGSPQMLVLAERIKTSQEQVRQLEARLTSQTAGSQTTISTMMTQFGELELEKQIAERLYASAATNLAAARLLAEQRRMYLNTFVQPSVPEEARYPRRLLFSGLATLALALVWASMIGLITLVRNYTA
ncbi:MAG: lipopolysaccharide biosynthesis protein [Beijerinckiaceae bacterium]